MTRRREPWPLAEELRRDFVELVVVAVGVEQVGADGRVLERGGVAAPRRPPLDEVLDIVADEPPAAEVGERSAQGQERALRGRMVETEGRHGRIGRGAVPHPVDRDGRVCGDGLKPLTERLGAIEHGHGLSRHLDGRRGGELAQQGVELELGPERPEPLPVRLLTPESFEVLLDRDPRAHGGQLPREERLLAMGRENLARFARDEREIVVEPRHAAELRDQLDRGLLADAGHPGILSMLSPMRARRSDARPTPHLR
jgi:hypothetical protein